MTGVQTCALPIFHRQEEEGLEEVHNQVEEGLEEEEGRHWCLAGEEGEGVVEVVEGLPRILKQGAVEEGRWWRRGLRNPEHPMPAEAQRRSSERVEGQGSGQGGTPPQ